MAKTHGSRDPSTPTALKLLRGNPGKRPLPANEPDPGPLDSTPPPGLSKDALKHWPLVHRQLDSTGVLSAMDGQALCMYCETHAAWRKALDNVARLGTVVVNPRSGIIMVSPHLRVANQMHDRMLKMLIEFGMTPASRPRVHAKKIEAANPFSDVNKGRVA